MSIAIINLSPRRQGTSTMLCKFIKENLGCSSVTIPYEDILKEEKKVNWIGEEFHTVIFVGPCYINTFPADTLRLLVLLESKKVMGHKNVYGIIQGGMPTIHTHKHGLLCLEIFAGQTGAYYKGGFVLGLGAMLDGKSVECLPNGRKAKKQLLQFTACIKNKEYANPGIYEKSELHLPVWVLKFLAHKMNQAIIKDLEEHKIEYKKESSYREMYD